MREPLIQPAARALVLRQRRDMGVDEQVCVDERYRNCSPSVTGRTSATSSMLATRHRPRETEGVRYALQGAGAHALPHQRAR
jgi:hypothetical protein